jgi:hypothetical protein
VKFGRFDECSRSRLTRPLIAPISQPSASPYRSTVFALKATPNDRGESPAHSVHPHSCYSRIFLRWCVSTSFLCNESGLVLARRAHTTHISTSSLSTSPASPLSTERLYDRLFPLAMGMLHRGRTIPSTLRRAFPFHPTRASTHHMCVV